MDTERDIMTNSGSFDYLDRQTAEYRREQWERYQESLGENETEDEEEEDEG